MSVRRMFSARKLVAHVLVAGALVAVLPALSAAQDKVYTAAELTTKPKIASMSRTAQLVQNSYPDKLKSAGVNGTVEVQFVIGPDGKVESNSVEVVTATVPALADAAKQVAAKIEFQPGKVDDAPVRTRVLLPIVYKAH